MIRSMSIDNLAEVTGAHPVIFNWPKRMLQSSSLSRVEPNLTNWGSSALLKRSLVVLSKHATIWSRLRKKSDSARNPTMLKEWAWKWLWSMNPVPSRNSRHRMLTKTEPWKWPWGEGYWFQFFFYDHRTEIYIVVGQFLRKSAWLYLKFDCRN